MKHLYKKSEDHLRTSEISKRKSNLKMKIKNQLYSSDVRVGRLLKSKQIFKVQGKSEYLKQVSDSNCERNFIERGDLHIDNKGLIENKNYHQPIQSHFYSEKLSYEYNKITHKFENSPKFQFSSREKIITMDLLNYYSSIESSSSKRNKKNSKQGRSKLNLGLKIINKKGGWKRRQKKKLSLAMWLSGDNFEKVGEFFPKRSIQEIRLQAAKISKCINAKRENLQAPENNYKVGKNSMFKIIKVETPTSQLPKSNGLSKDIQDKSNCFFIDAYSFSKENCCNSDFDDKVIFEQGSYQKESEKGICHSSVNNMNNSTPTPFDFSITSENIKKDQRSKILSRACTDVGEKNVDYENFDLYKNLEIFNDSSAGLKQNIKTNEDSRNSKILMVEKVLKYPGITDNINKHGNFNSKFNQNGFSGSSENPNEIKNLFISAFSPNMAPNFLNINNLYQKILNPMFTSCLDQQLSTLQNVFNNYNLEKSNQIFQENLMPSLYLLQTITNMYSPNVYNSNYLWNQSQEFNNIMNYLTYYEVMLMDLINKSNVVSHH